MVLCVDQSLMPVGSRNWKPLTSWWVFYHTNQRRWVQYTCVSMWPVSHSADVCVCTCVILGKYPSLGPSLQYTSFLRDEWKLLWHRTRTINESPWENAGLDVMESHTLCRTCFGQYQCLSATLGRWRLLASFPGPFFAVITKWNCGTTVR